MSSRVVHGVRPRLLCALVLLASAARAGEAAPAPPPPAPERAGDIKVFTATGDAQWRGADGRTVALARDVVLSGEGEFICGAAGSAFVVFANGNALLLPPGAELAVTRYRQAPFDAARTYFSLARNPSRSDLALALRAGEITMSILAVSPAAEGSTFSLATPAGTLTAPSGTLRAALVPGAAAGETVVTLQALKGTLEFRPVLPEGVPPIAGPPPVPLPPGSGVVARVRRDAAGRVVALNLLGLAGPRGEIQHHTHTFSVALSKAYDPTAPDRPYPQPYVPEPAAPRDLPLAPAAGTDTYYPAGTVVPR